ncbi:MAG: ribonuclease HII [Candidatus Marinimicrobia bacterium]|nr:ribonuclease HII [Candidatus Neomarinimicrobiota bacterium]
MLKDKRLDEPIDLLSYENQLWTNGVKTIAGIDEAGRGPLAGPVVAAAVILDQREIPEGVNDSKKLTAKNRDILFDLIKEKSVDYSTGIVWQDEIDKSDILRSTHLAMRKAIGSLKEKPEHLLIDGRRFPDKIFKQTAIISGDSLSASIASASIIAKVTRDRIMLQISKIYPEYEFEKHKGYGTSLHINRINQFGPSPAHRHTFKRVKGIKPKVNLNDPKQLGKYGEKIACLELIKEGYEILEQNYWAGGREYELDIVVKKDNAVVFVEVKSKYHEGFGEPEQWVGEKKQAQISKAAQSYLMEKNPDGEEYRFDVIAIKFLNDNYRIKHIIDAFRS